jgi:glycosyltransferase involved in cell wall biosynthesis
MSSVLMVAFHYPPCFGSSGILRTLKFSRYLPGCGWKPVVLTAHPRAYRETSRDQMGEIPSTVPVTRAFALDTWRHLAIAGSSLRVMALPDGWVTWTFGAVPAGLRLIRQHRPVAIWSTYPIATAHLIGLILHRLTGLPWVADLRDSMTEEGYPRDPATRRAYLAIERWTVRRAARLVFTARSARTMYLNRYPHLDPARCLVITNGYDEADFTDLVPPAAGPPRRPDEPLRLLHAGLIYPEERDPRPFFRALGRLRRQGRIGPETLAVNLRASGSEETYARLLAELDLSDVVHLLPAVSYRQVLRECLDSDALLLLQGPSCNHQIPAKLYEYLRLGKPIVALTDSAGDSAAVLAETGGATIIDLLDEEALYGRLPELLRSIRSGTHPVPDPVATARHSRQRQAGELARCLGEVAWPNHSRLPDHESADRAV